MVKSMIPDYYYKTMSVRAYVCSSDPMVHVCGCSSIMSRCRQISHLRIQGCKLLIIPENKPCSCHLRTNR